ncbi:MAG: hypothetical protein COB02_16435 [Candidatus Cloacimonadota bacterium]|nr:MAG: hypothetical protein COB02_16435 [Candidatus Cloacimonadota bacterium]
MSRVVHIKSGRMMVVSDIQGNKRDFDRIIQIYHLLKQHKKIEYLLICGDLVHGYPGYEDESFDLLNSIIKLRKSDKNIIHLMGNHELAHVLHWNLKKGMIDFTTNLEEKIKSHRSNYWDYLSELPFAVTTENGIFINHTGPSKALGGVKDPIYDLYLSVYKPHLWYQNLNFYKDFKMNQSLKNTFDAEFGMKIKEKPEGYLTWEVFMNKNEYEYKKKYPKVIDTFLENMSNIYPVKLLISSHIEESEGYKIVSSKHFRVCTSYGANDDEDKKYLYLDTQTNFESAQDLISRLRPLW